MEGIEPGKYESLLGLDSTPYTTKVACALGYRHQDDTYANNAKVRFDRESMIKSM
jgi:hypothetical protein